MRELSAAIIDQIVQDRLDKKRIDCDFVAEIEDFVYEEINRRYRNGQDLNTLKFDELYREGTLKACESMTAEMEVELHEKMKVLLPSKIDGSDNPSTIDAQSPSAINADISSEDSTDRLPRIVDTTSDVASNEKNKK